MKIRISVWTCSFLSVVLLALAPQAWSQCTDGDLDGFFVETGCSTPQDCNDDDASSYPGGVEVCDGRDNDCDGLLDNDAACDRSCATPELVGVEVSLTTDTTGHPSVAWSGTGYGIAHWTSLNFTILSLLSPYGQPTGTADHASPDGEYPVVLWTGSTYGLAEAPGSGSIFFTRLDADGNVLTSSELVSERDTTMTLDLAWSGYEYALTWVDRDSAEIYFARLDASGTKIGADVRVTNATGSSSEPSIVWTGSEYGMAWHDSRDGNDEIYFCRLDASGVKIGADVRVTVDSSQSQAPSLTWTGSEYGLAWQDDRSTDWEIYFTRMSSAGVKTGGDVQVAAATSTGPELIWVGAEYGLVWEHQPATVGQIYFARLDASGTKIGSDLRVSDTGNQSYATLIWTGTEYGVSWQTTDWEVHFRRIGCDCVDDDDGDGVHSCDDCDESNPQCTIDCTDEDEDGYCVTHDCNDANAACTTDCTDVDQDGLPVCAGDCDDGNPNCTTDCTDGDTDGLCITHDCDDTLAGCTTDCSDVDADGLAACAGDCDDTNAYCTTDCTDADGDGYCVTTDCNDANANCTSDCTDVDQDGYCFDSDCNDNDPNNWISCAACVDADSDTWYVLCDNYTTINGPDCDDGNANCTSDCTDADYDGYCAPVDCDDGDERCSTDCTDIDQDGYCVTDDCDDTLPYCAIDCTDLDQDGYCVGVDCDDALPGVHACDRACAVPGRLGEESYIARGVSPFLVYKSWHPGKDFAVFYQTSTSLVNDMYFARFSGEVGFINFHDILSTDYVNTCGVKGGPAAAWNGFDWGVVWGWMTECELRASELHYERLISWGELDPDFDPRSITGPMPGWGNSFRPSMVWDDTGYGIAWQDSRNGWTVRFARLHRGGWFLSPEIEVSDVTDRSERPSLVWTGSEFGVAWENWRDGNADIYFARIDADGTKIGSNVLVTGGSHDSLAPSLVWDGTGYGIAWHDDREGDTQVYLARLDSTGNKIGSDVRITATPNASEGASVAWTGEEYGLCWSDSRSGSSDIYFASVDAAGNKLDRDVRVSYLTSTSGQCAIVWSETYYGIAWSGDNNIYFTRIGCDCPDGDGDTGSACMDCDDTNPACLLDCSDGDGDGLAVCEGDCDNTNTYCTTDCTDPDGDGHCVTHDCDETNPACNLDCSDLDGDGLAVCEGDCDDTRPHCDADCLDLDGDGFCTSNDCDDTNPLCTVDCTDPDDDGMCRTPNCELDEFCDNCPLHSNPSQVDRDDDGEGDVCDHDDGVIHLYFDDADWIQWDPESGFTTWNCYSGDLDVLRSDETYTQEPGSNPLAARDCDLASPFVASSIVPDPGEVSFMLATGVFDGVEGDLGTDSAGITRPNDNSCLP